MHQKKRHHYIAQTYLRGFCNQQGKVCVYSKDKPEQPWWAAPEAVGFEKYYYSQPTPGGGQDNNRLEDFFSSIEANWPTLIRKIERRESHEGGLDQLLEFALMHRVRVPALRDAAERMLAESVRMTMHSLFDGGKLPPLPLGISFDDLDRSTVITIDPHRSIHVMKDFADGMSKIIMSIGFEILENRTGESFITSDNPVIYFDPLVSDSLMQPYNINRRRMDVEFMFPLTPRYMLWGHSVLKPRTGEHHQTYYRTVTDRSFVSRANLMAARFAHRMVFSDTVAYQALVKRYAATSPVIVVSHLKNAVGRGIFSQFVFGRREPKPKWKKRECAE